MRHLKKTVASLMQEESTQIIFISNWKGPLWVDPNSKVGKLSSLQAFDLHSPKISFIALYEIHDETNFELIWKSYSERQDDES